MRITPVELVVQGIPEIIAIATLSFTLAGVGFKWRHIVPLGILLAVIIYLIRLLPVPFGVHAIVVCIALAGYLHSVFGTTLLRGLYAAFMTLALLIFFEYVAHAFLFNVTGLSYEVVKDNRLLWALFGWPQVVLLFATAIVVDLARRRYRRCTGGG